MYKKDEIIFVFLLYCIVLKMCYASGLVGFSLKVDSLLKIV